MVRDAARGVAVGEVQRHALGVPGEQVWGHAGVDVHRVIEHRATQLKIRRTAHQLGELHGPLGSDPAGGVIRLGQRGIVQRFHSNGLPGQNRFPQGQGVGRHLQLGVVLAQHQQQFGTWHFGMVDHRDRGLGHGCHVLQEGGTLAVGGQHHGVRAGELAFQHRELVASVACEHADPAGDGARRLERAGAGLVAEHKRQLDGAVVPGVEERCRQQREVVAQRDLPQRKLQLAVVADGGPQAGMGGRFTFHRVVADELKAEPVVVREIARVDVQLDRLWCAQTLLVEHHCLQGFVVEHQLEMRQRRDQCR